VKRTSLTAAAAAFTLLALSPAAQAATTQTAAHGPAPHLYIEPSSARQGTTFAVIAVCPRAHAIPIVSAALLPGAVELDNGISPSFALLDVGPRTRPHRYPFWLHCLSGRHTATARAVLTVLGPGRTRKRR
jgi:hypothetical protein